MQEMIVREELKHSLFEMSLHGIDPDEINKIKSNFERQFKNKKKIKEESKINLLRLTSIKGFKYGKKSRTKVINRP